jgi:hypothetical protein
LLIDHDEFIEGWAETQSGRSREGSAGAAGPVLS